LVDRWSHINVQALPSSWASMKASACAFSKDHKKCNGSFSELKWIGGRHPRVTCPSAADLHGLQHRTVSRIGRHGDPAARVTGLAGIRRYAPLGPRVAIPYGQLRVLPHDTLVAQRLTAVLARLDSALMAILH